MERIHASHLKQTNSKGEIESESYAERNEDRSKEALSSTKTVTDAESNADM